MLCADRVEKAVNFVFFMDEVAQKGSFVFLKETNTSYREVTLKRTSECVGILLDDVVHIDLTRYPLNFYGGEVQKGGKVRILTNGTVSLKIPGREKYPKNHPLYMNPDGKLTLVQWGFPIGKLLSNRDKNGYARAEIEL